VVTGDICLRLTQSQESSRLEDALSKVNELFRVMLGVMVYRVMFVMYLSGVHQNLDLQILTLILHQGSSYFMYRRRVLRTFQRAVDSLFVLGTGR
jgi:hypothetical protein